MKAQGTDGLSRGQLREGVSLGRAMYQYCPWAQMACKRSPKLVSWLRSWIGQDAEVLSPSDWFKRGHDHDGGSYDQANKEDIKKDTGGSRPDRESLSGNHHLVRPMQ